MTKCAWVENPHVKECTLSNSPPKISYNNDESGSIFLVGSLVPKMFTGGGLYSLTGGQL